ncbi:TPA: phosphoribosyltransferase [Streptococcus suis]|nr:phosphoribosyltransferase [Streptococcus suis]HEM5228369.1 phosphoribosyltransferase [Streptococcus suis]HEM5229242.1 phosphoribosyltransferase [Streptococcus suis]
MISLLRQGNQTPKGVSIGNLKVELKKITKKINEYEGKKKGALNEYSHEFASFIQTKNVIIIDDFLCTGTSVKNFLEDNLEDIRRLKDVKFLFLFLEATSIGRDTINSFIADNELVNVKIAYGQDSVNVDNAIQQDTRFDYFTFKIEEEKINENFGLGKSDYQCRTAIATFINSPNSNCRFLNSRGTGKWEPLFERENRREINIDSEALKDVIAIYAD